MKFLMLLPLMFLSGCLSIFPVKPKFPEVPSELLEKCKPLKTMEEKETTFSELSKTIVINYNQYHECSIKNETWIEWYRSQKKIYEEINKGR